MARSNKETIAIDAIVGLNIQSLRIAHGLSRQQLAEKIDVTHQQLQKYEKGTNRVSASRLYAIANAFYVQVDELYNDGEITKDKNPRNRIVLELMRGFNNLAPKQQDIITDLVRAM